MFFREMLLNRSYLIMAIMLFAATFFLPTAASASTISISPASGSYQSGQTFTTNIRVQPQGNDVNAVEASMSFDRNVLEVVNLSRDGSVFSLWTTEPTFSNSAGTITFGGGSPTPFTSASTILTATFRVIGAGSGEVRFDNVSILVADGMGTDVFAGATSGTYTSTAATTPPPPPPPPPETPTPTPAPTPDGEALTFGDPPRTPEIGSQTFLDPNEWYRAKTGIFTWSLPFDVSAVAIALSTTSEMVPYEDFENVFDPPIEEFQITEEMIGDGVWYLHVAYENQVGWGSILHRKIQIDATPPEPFEVNVRQGSTPSSFPSLQFSAEDETSGIAYYELVINNREPVVITPDEAAIGFLLGNLIDGTYTAYVTAYDRAGNTREASAPVIITAGWEPPSADDEESSFWSFLTAANILIFFLFVIIILLGVYIWYVQKLAKQREEKLRRETREIQDQMEKIFSALRDEIYDQINTITKRKRLSASEREAIASLNQALEVSETLIEKEINDVKSILR